MTEEEKEVEKEKERRRQRQIKVTALTFYVLCAMFTGGVAFALYFWGIEKRDEEGNPIIDRFSDYPAYKQYVLRAFNELMNVKEEIVAPSRDLLLPPPLTYPYMQPPYTLVLELKSE